MADIKCYFCGVDFDDEDGFVDDDTGWHLCMDCFRACCAKIERESPLKSSKESVGLVIIMGITVILFFTFFIIMALKDK